MVMMAAVDLPTLSGWEFQFGSFSLGNDMKSKGMSLSKASSPVGALKNELSAPDMAEPSWKSAQVFWDFKFGH